MLSRERGSSAGRRLLFPFLAVFSIIVSTILLFSSRSDVGSTGGTQTTVMDSFVLPLTLLSLPLRGSEQALKNARERKLIFRENQKLKEEIIALSDVRMRADVLALKIKRYEEMLEADPGIDIPFRRIPARLVSENDGPFARSALLNAGTKSGVKTGYAVMTEHGLYGHIIAAGRRSSRALQLQDINSRIAVLTPRTEARAILIGTNGTRPVLSFIRDKADWRDGDIVMTSGDEGVLPQGLPIGVVRKSQDNQFFVDLYSDDSLKDWVYVFSFTPILPPETDEAVGNITPETLPEGELDDAAAQGRATAEAGEN
jgi:rod shape-determining protein MreC